MRHLGKKPPSLSNVYDVQQPRATYNLFRPPTARESGVLPLRPRWSGAGGVGGGEERERTHLDVGCPIPPEGVEKGDHLRATATAVHVHDHEHPVHVALVDRDEELLHVEQRRLSAGQPGPLRPARHPRVVHHERAVLRPPIPRTTQKGGGGEARQRGKKIELAGKTLDQRPHHVSPFIAIVGIASIVLQQSVLLPI